MAELILHIGAHRCASTTLQLTLRDRRSDLAAAGVSLWLPAQTRAGALAGLVCRPDRLSEEVEAAARDSREAIRRQLDRPDCRRLLISDENLAGSVRRNLASGLLYADIAPRLARLGPELCDRVTQVAFALRSYEDYWSSSLRMGLWRGLPAPGPQARDRMAQAPRRWPAVIADIAAALPAAEILVMPFENCARHPGQMIAQMTGLPSEAARPVDIRHNAAPALAELRQRLSARGEAAALDLLTGEDGEWSPFAPEVGPRLAAAYQADIAGLAARLPGRLRLLRPAAPPVPARAAARPAPPAQAPRAAARGRAGQAA